MQGYDFELFSLQNNPPKTEVTYFKQLLKHYHLKPKDAVYFDHLQANLDAAHQTGISGILYTTIETALDYFAKDRQYINLNFKIQKIWDDIISGKKQLKLGHLILKNRKNILVQLKCELSFQQQISIHEE